MKFCVTSWIFVLLIASFCGCLPLKTSTTRRVVFYNPEADLIKSNVLTSELKCKSIDHHGRCRNQRHKNIARV